MDQATCNRTIDRRKTLGSPAHSATPLRPNQESFLKKRTFNSIQYIKHSTVICSVKVEVISKIMYEGKKKKLVTSSFCRAVARHTAPRARPGGAESTDLPVYRVFRRFMFEFYAWVLAEDDDCDDRRM